MNVEKKQNIEANLENQRNQRSSEEKHWLRDNKIVGLIDEAISRSRKYLRELHEDTKSTW